MSNFYTIRALARPSSTVLALHVGKHTGKTRFVAMNGKLHRPEVILLSPVATEEILEELEEKCAYSSWEGRVLIRPMVSPTTKTFINECWDELKQLKPEFCIK